MSVDFCRFCRLINSEIFISLWVRVNVSTFYDESVHLAPTIYLFLFYFFRVWTCLHMDYLELLLTSWKLCILKRTSNNINWHFNVTHVTNVECNKFGLHIPNNSASISFIVCIIHRSYIFITITTFMNFSSPFAKKGPSLFWISKWPKIESFV